MVEIKKLINKFKGGVNKLMALRTKKELFFIDSAGNDNFYQMHLSIFENY